jgi:hypothetical protein
MQRVHFVGATAYMYLCEAKAGRYNVFRRYCRCILPFIAPLGILIAHHAHSFSFDSYAREDPHP